MEGILAPRWHSDIKWIFSLLAVATLALTLFILGLYRLTAREAAVPLMTTAIAAAFSPEGLDDEVGFAAAKRQLTTSGRLEPFPGLDITLTPDEIENKSPREIRLLVFGKLAAPLYDEGIDELAQRAPTPAAAAKFKNDAQLLGLLSKHNHELLRPYIWGVGGIAVLFLTLAIIFSHRAGRVATPGVILLVASIVPAVFWSLLKMFALNPPTGSPLGPEQASPIGQAVRLIIPIVADAFLPGYLVAALAGLGLVLIALVVKIIQRRRTRRSSQPRHQLTANS